MKRQYNMEERPSLKVVPCTCVVGRSREPEAEGLNLPAMMLTGCQTER